jgi:phosphatidylglycerophosphate synthase/putative flippase GtrA
MLETITNWLSGDLNSAERIWLALAPVILLFTYFFGGIPVYWIRTKIWGPYVDPELSERPASKALNMWVRMCFAWLMRPVWWVLLKSKIPPNAITMLSLLLSIGSGVALASGRFALGGWLYLFAGMCDFFDGRIARHQGSSTRSGAALDSILDRYSDSAVLMGLAWFYRDTWVLFPTLLSIVGSSLVPYIKAKGEASGLSVNVGMMQRAERVVYLGFFSSMSPIVEVILDPTNQRPLHRLAVAGILLLAVSTHVTALQRFVYVLNALSEKAATKWLGLGKGSPARNFAAGGVATLADFALVNLLVVSAAFLPPIATAVGCALGAVINFAINRSWTFGSSDPAMPQMWRYGFVSVSSALLNAGGVAVMLFLPDVDYRIGWWLVRGAVFVTWNYPLHRDYVFGYEPPQPVPVRSAA